MTTAHSDCLLTALDMFYLLTYLLTYLLIYLICNIGTGSERERE